MTKDSSCQPAADVALVCQNCEAEVPAGAAHCPRCCGVDGQLGESKRRAVIGGLVGFMAGGVAAAVYSSIVGPESGNWSVVGGIALAGIVFGVLLGVFNRPRTGS